MKKSIIGLLVVFAIIGCATQQSEKAVDYVNPFIGTGFHGHTYPGATLPNGAVQLSPDTRRGNWDACAGYHYSDDSLRGFSHTHLSGTGCIDLGDVLFHPTTKALNLVAEGYIFNKTPFSHNDEVASPGYYKVKLKETGITVELTATQHTGIHQYSFPKSENSKIIIDLAHTLGDEILDSLALEVEGDTVIKGMRISSGWVANQRVYFYAKFSKAFKSVKLISSGKIINNSRAIVGKNIQAVVEFTTEADEKIESHVGISQVSIANAKQNLQTEAPNFGFEAIKEQAASIWEEALNSFVVSGGTKAQKQTFYTALYHSKVVPNITNDVNGAYRTHDNKINTIVPGEKMLSTLSIWDTYRAWNPLMTLIDSNLTANYIRSMLNMYKVNGELPTWPLASGETGTMIGYHSAAVIAEAYLKGIRGFDAALAFEAMKASSNNTRHGRKYYVQNGFIPSNILRESVSSLLEYAYDDWSIAMMAKEMGKQKDYEEYARRSMSYVNVYDGATGFFRGKRADGNWDNPFDPQHSGGEFTEANAWQYLFYVPHDMKGLFNLMGGQDKFLAKLDQLFVEKVKEEFLMPDMTGLIGQYVHGNEPSHHIAYLYNYAGQPWKTQAMTRKILKEMYGATPEGIAGNEDCGQMSAWYIMSSIGLYAVAPSSGEYALTSPLFEKTVIKLYNGKQLTVKANNPADNIYIDKVTLNGVEISKNFITHKQLMEGGELNFTLTNKPNKQRGTKDEDALYSETKQPMVSVPFINGDLFYFIDKVSFGMGSNTQGATIRYTLDGTTPTEASPIYNSIITIDKSLIVKARAFKKGHLPSPINLVSAEKAVFKKPDQMTAGKNGVAYRYFDGAFSNVHDMLKAPVVKQGQMDKFTVAGFGRQDYYGYEFKGLFYAPVDGVYDFYTASDDGSVLIIGDKEVVNNDGPHGIIKSTGRKALNKGYHAYTLLYFESYEGEKLDVGWKKPGAKEFESMNSSSFFLP